LKEYDSNEKSSKLQSICPSFITILEIIKILHYSDIESTRNIESKVYNYIDLYNIFILNKLSLGVIISIALTCHKTVQVLKVRFDIDSTISLCCSNSNFPLNSFVLHIRSFYPTAA